MYVKCDILAYRGGADLGGGGGEGCYDLIRNIMESLLELCITQIPLLHLYSASNSMYAGVLILSPDKQFPTFNDINGHCQRVDNSMQFTRQK